MNRAERRKAGIRNTGSEQICEQVFMMLANYKDIHGCLPGKIVVSQEVYDAWIREVNTVLSKRGKPIVAKLETFGGAPIEITDGESIGENETNIAMEGKLQADESRIALLN